MSQESINNEVLSLLKQAQALITDSHMVGVSGRHMSVYVNKDALLAHPLLASRIGELFAEKNKDLNIDAVAAPAMGAIILGHLTAFHLSKVLGKEILSVYTDKIEGDEQVLKRGYDKLIAGKNVLVVEDTTTTGGSVQKTVQKVREAGGNVLRVCVVMNRDPKNINTASMGVSFDSLATLEAQSFEESECPLCKANVPVNTSVGHGKKYLEEKAKRVA